MKKLLIYSLRLLILVIGASPLSAAENVSTQSAIATHIEKIQKGRELEECCTFFLGLTYKNREAHASIPLAKAYRKIARHYFSTGNKRLEINALEALQFIARKLNKPDLYSNYFYSKQFENKPTSESLKSYPGNLFSGFPKLCNLRFSLPSKKRTSPRKSKTPKRLRNEDDEETLFSLDFCREDVHGPLDYDEEVVRNELAATASAYPEDEATAAHCG